MDRTRRRILGLSAGVLTAGLAGCNELGSEENEPDASPPDWQRWVPSEVVTERDATLVHMDIQQAEDEFPTFYEELNVTETTDSLGIDQSTVEDFLVASTETRDFVVLLGEFEVETVLETLQQDPDEEYRGYDIFRFTNGGDAAFGDGVGVIAHDVDLVIDTSEDESGYLGDENDDWNTMLSYLTNPAFGVAQTGLPDDADLSLAPERAVAYIEPLDSANATTTTRLQYSSSETAEDAWDGNSEDDFETLLSDAVALSDSSRQGRQIIVEGQGPREEIAEL